MANKKYSIISTDRLKTTEKNTIQKWYNTNSNANNTTNRKAKIYFFSVLRLRMKKPQSKRESQKKAQKDAR